ncbi:tetratricopeptide repeat protein 1-like isoform X2 [Camellia sinensis]|uniref:tetratricopeptide repeat protein 1-like isoform X2 n=1 Tax=Camellia sinensis TaxID=4442 RepID=UPI001035FFF2|nr:tetratricopeptide repeat protein 1-like isoform X2 [Camellia sinensis]
MAGIFHSTFKWKHWVGFLLTFFTYVIPYQQLATMAKPTYSESGELEDGGFDLTTDGVCGYLHDVIYITGFVQLTTIISEKFWYIYLVIPAFATYKLLGFVKGFMSLGSEKALVEANDAKLDGNRLFGDGQYEEALVRYEVALQVAPEMPSSVEIRSICHANCAICFFKLECTKALELNPNYVKALRRRGEAHEKLQHFEEAIADMKKIFELDQSDVQARRTIQRLEPLAAEKRER